MLFLRKAKLDTEPMPIKMSGVRMGERLLQIGVDNPKLAGGLAAKVGLSGRAAMVVEPGMAEGKARSAAAGAGALLDVHVAPLGTLPFENQSFDVVVVNSVGGLLSSLEPRVRTGALDESRRVLRHGGRIIVLQPGPRSGLMGLLRPVRIDAQYEQAGGTAAALETVGFRPVRLLGERDGYRFFEGLKT